MAFPVIISFYTKNTPYETEVQNLIGSCDRFGLERSIEGVESFGNWELNCAFKPFFILKKLEELNRPCLWVDADGVVVQKPSWEEAFNYDLAVRYEPSLPDDHPSKVISSTIFIRPEAIPLIKVWIKESYFQLLDPERELEFWDQIALRDALNQNSFGIKVARLPLAYAKIFDHPLDKQKVESPVIEHFQASRRFKNILNHNCK